MRFLVPLVLLAGYVLAAPSAISAWFNGANVPWDSFGYDIGTGNFNKTWFQTFFTECQQNHINSARFWLHCDGRATPTFNSDGSVQGLSSTFISDLTTLTGMAKNYSVVIVLSLWSFDMFNGQPGHPDLVSDQSKTTSYINNALIPIVKALESYENVIFEIMNEPEWAIDVTPATTPQKVTLQQMQRFHGMLAEAIHKTGSHTVTTGSASLKWDSAAVPPAVANWWDDAALKAAYSSSLGTLDFYQIHYYDWMHDPSWGYDPCRENTAYWKLDKVTMVGELPSDAGTYYTPDQFMNCSYNNGFAGTMYWAYNADWPLSSALPALNNFYNAHQSISTYQALVNWAKSLRP
jgi:hypothetical protein